MSSEISRRPRKSATEAASQCAVSARGTIVLRRREIGDEAGGYEDREHETDEDDEQRPLEDVVVEIAAAIPVEDEDAIGLRHAPDEAGKDREGSQQLKHERPPWTALDARLLSFPRDAGCDVGAHPYLPSRKSGGKAPPFASATVQAASGMIRACAR